MNKSRLGLGTLTLLFGMALAGGVQAGEEAKPGVESIGVEAARDYVAGHDDAVIMDVRTPTEFEMSHITGAINANVQDDDFESLIAGLDKDKTYLVHCTRNPENGRSSRALEALQRMGFKNLMSLEGGYVAWKEAELPLTEAEN